MVKRDGGVHVLAEEAARDDALENGFDLFGARMQLFLRGARSKSLTAGLQRAEWKRTHGDPQRSCPQRDGGRQIPNRSLADLAEVGVQGLVLYVRRTTSQLVKTAVEVATMSAHQELQVGLPDLELLRVVFDGPLKQLLDQDHVGALDFSFPRDIVEVRLSRVACRFLRARLSKSVNLVSAGTRPE